MSSPLPGTHWVVTSTGVEPLYPAIATFVIAVRGEDRFLKRASTRTADFLHDGGDGDDRANRVAAPRQTESPAVGAGLSGDGCRPRHVSTDVSVP